MYYIEKNFVKNQTEAILVLTALWCLLEMDLLFPSELVLDSLTTVSYYIESFYLLNWFARNLNTKDVCVVVVLKTSINFKVRSRKCSTSTSTSTA